MADPTLNIYLDAALTTQAVPPFVFQQFASGSGGPHQRQVFLGSTDTGALFEALSDPGVDQITLSITDASPGSGQEASSIKLAATLAGLASAVAGAALDLGTSISAGAAGAKEIWIEWDDTTGVVATDLNLSIGLNAIKVTP